MERSVNNVIANCSTPLFAEENNRPDLPLSGIRRDKTLPPLDFIAVQKRPKRKPKERHRRNGQENTDPDADSSFETIAVYKTHSTDESRTESSWSPRNFQGLNNQVRVSKNIGDGSNLSPKLFFPLPEDEHTSGRYNNSFFSKKAFSPLLSTQNQTIGSPVFQKSFKDPTMYKTYSIPGKKTKLSPSKISFGQKQVDRISSKNDSTNRVRFKGFDNSAETDPRNEALRFNKSSLYCADKLWEKLMKNDDNSVKQSSGSEYSQTADKHDRCKRFVAAPHRKKGAVKEPKLEEFRGHKKKKVELSPTNKEISGNNPKSVLANQLWVSTNCCKNPSRKPSTGKRLKPLQETFEENSIGCNLSAAGPASDKSTPKIISNVKVKINVNKFKKKKCFDHNLGHVL